MLIPGEKQGISRPQIDKNRSWSNCAIEIVLKGVATQTYMVNIHVQQQKIQAFLHSTTILTPTPSGLSTSLANH